MRLPIPFVFAGALTVASSCAIAANGAAQAVSDWPSYNRTLTSDRFSPLDTINASNVSQLTVHCTFDTGEVTGFQSGLVQTDGALFATTEHGTYSIDPNTCALNWKAWEDFSGGYLDSQHGVAVANGRVFRGGRNGYVYAYDEKTGAQLWNVALADPGLGESIPASPIVWNGMVFIGTAGGDTRGVKGRMYGLDAATGKVVWEFYMVPKSPSDPERGPQAQGAAPSDTWQNVPLTNISGGGTWTSFTLDAKRGELYVPGGNPSPDFANDLRQGSNLFSGSVLVLDALTGAYKRYYSLVPSDFHDWDVASAPALATIRGRRLMASTPKNGMLYTYDLDSGRRLYQTAVTTRLNADQPLSEDTPTRFCPGSQGGSEWNGPAFDLMHAAIITGEVDWCVTAKLASSDDTLAVPVGQAWTGADDGGFGTLDQTSAGWVTSVDAVTGQQRWRFRAPKPIVTAVTPTAGNLVFFGDLNGTFYALNASNGRVLKTWALDGGLGGGVITYDTGAGQRVAVAAGMSSAVWSTVTTPGTTAKIVVLAADRVAVPRRVGVRR
jgi:PQQ-dependent dehydrogenase (methanol/ethanol family)